ncbi:MAG: aldehyde ferredoxin oxidoreductase family protein [Chloroflexi bacterium]|nr:aldehyde ferredoxin oxidoreductase family protein [Chloroflexota bacterium]
MAPAGYMGAILDVDLTTRTHRVRELTQEMTDRWLGGTGLGAHLLWEEQTYNADPLGPDNVMVWATGPFAGTAVPLSNRFGVCARSPLTGVWGEAECGGHWANDLKKAGYDALIVRGKADAPVYVWIHDQQVEFRDAGHLWGKDTFETHDTVRAEIGSGSRRGQEPGVACIGPAGERLVRFAAIMVDGKDGRAVGRSGLGAVMGSKNLKAVAVKGTLAVKIADEPGLNDYLKDLRKEIVSTSKGFGALGTAGGIPTHDKMGNWPIKNWQQDHWPEAPDKISGAAMKESILTGRYYCGNCIIGCGRTVEVNEGPYAGIEQGGLEYETTSLNGSNLLIDDLPAVQKLNEICNRLGMDTISAGATIGFTMEAYERGLIKPGETDGLDITWGNHAAATELMRRIGEREGQFATRLGEGTLRVARQIGGEAFAVHVRGLDFPAHDPRAYFANAVAYATSHRGADHLSSFAHVFQRTVSLPDLGYDEPVHRQDAAATPRLVMIGQNLMSWFDSLKCCKFLFFGGIKPTHIWNWYRYVTGNEVSLDSLLETGERIFLQKRLFNLACGSGPWDDTMPPRILELPREIGTGERSVPPFAEMLAEYYALRQWDPETGAIAPEVLERLGLPEPILAARQPVAVA